VILRCTKKLLDVIKPGTLAGEPANDEDWSPTSGPPSCVTPGASSPG
jgi:hypothetical protein